MQNNILYKMTTMRTLTIFDIMYSKTFKMRYFLCILSHVANLKVILTDSTETFSKLRYTDSNHHLPKLRKFFH